MIYKIIILFISISSLLIGQKFDGKPLSCFHCKENKIEKKFLRKLKRLERKCGFDFYVTCGYRCEHYNTQIKGYYKSRHMDGLAVDISSNLSRNQVTRLRKLACKSGYFTKVIDEHDHFHIESGGNEFEFKEKPYTGKYKNESYTNTWYFGIGQKYSKSSYIRLGYYMTDGCGVRNYYIYADKAITDNKFSFDNKISIGIGTDNFLNEPFYYGFHLLLSNIENYDTTKPYLEPNINIGLLYKFINFQISCGIAVLNDNMAYFSEGTRSTPEAFHINGTVTVGLFKKNNDKN